MKKKLTLIASCSCIIILGFSIFKYFNHGKALKEVKPPDSKIVNTSDTVEKTSSFENLKIEDGNPNEMVTNNDSIEKISSFKRLKIEEGKSDEIVLKTGTIHEDMDIVGVKDEKNFYVLSESSDLCIYNTETKKTQVFKKAMGKNMFILNVAFSNKWTVWIECTSGKTTDSSTDMGWTMYAENIHTGKILVIDRDINTTPCGFKYSPFQISISGDNIVYSIYKRTSDKSINAVIKLANLENKNVCELDKIKDVDNYFYSNPSICNENIVWSITKSSKDPEKNKMISNVILYNIVDKSKTSISKDMPIYDPRINNNLIFADFKVDSIYNIVLYDLNKKNQGWNNYINNSLSIYKSNEPHVMSFSSFSENYIIWWSDAYASSQVIDTTDNKIYILDKNKNVYAMCLYNKIIFWKEHFPDEPRKVIIKYAILK